MSTAMAFIPLLVNVLIVVAVVYGIYRLLCRKNDRGVSPEILRLQEKMQQLQEENLQLRSEIEVLREQVEKMQEGDDCQDWPSEGGSRHHRNERA